MFSSVEKYFSDLKIYKKISLGPLAKIYFIIISYESYKLYK